MEEHVRKEVSRIGKGVQNPEPVKAGGALSFLDKKFDNVPVHRKIEINPSQQPINEKFKSKLRPMQKFQDEINEIHQSKNLDALDLSMK